MPEIARSTKDMRVTRLVDNKQLLIAWFRDLL